MFLHYHITAVYLASANCIELPKQEHQQEQHCSECRSLDLVVFVIKTSERSLLGRLTSTNLCDAPAAIM